MAEQAPPRFEIAASMLRQFPVHSTYYNSFFVLRTEVVLNGQPAEIGCADDGELTLCCRYFPATGNYSTTKPSVSIQSIYAKVEEILKSHGVREVKGFFYEDSPLYSVSFSSEHALKELLKKKARVEEEIAKLLSRNLQPTQQPKADTAAVLVPTCVKATLFLMTPDPATKDCAKPIEVTLGNHSTCMAVWKESEVFDFGDVFRTHRLDRTTLLDQGEVKLTSVLQELEMVFEWFVLGTHLNLPQHELKMIQQDHPSNSKECRVAMVDTWIRLGNASWSGLVRALWEIGRCGLAKKLAYKFGATLPPAALRTSDQKVQATDEALRQPQQTGTAQGQLLSSIEQQDRRLEQQTKSVEKVAGTKTKVSENRTNVKRCLTAALNKVDRLLQEKDTLNIQLTEKELWLQTLQTSEVNLQSMVEGLERDIEQLKDQLMQKDEEIADVSSEANDLRAQLHEATAELVRASSELTKLKSERETLSNELEKGRRKLEKEQLQSVFKRERITELKGEVVAITTDSKAKEREIGVLEGRMSAQNEEIERLRRALQESEQRKPAQLPEHPSPAATLQQQLLKAMETSDLRVKLATAEEGRQEVERQLGVLQRQMQLLEEEMKRESQKEGVVEKLQLAQGTHVKSIDGLKFPFKLAVSDSGEIVVAECDSNNVSVFHGEGRKLLSFGNQESADMKLVRPHDVALLSDNTVLVAADHCVKKFRMDGTFIASVGSKGSRKLQFDTPWAVAADERGRKIYVCDTDNHRIRVLNFDLSYHSSFGSKGIGPQQFNYPDGIAIDSHQNVFVADYCNDRVQVLNSEGGFLYQIKQRGTGMEGLSRPVSVCIDQDDNVYVLEHYKCRVSIFSNKGDFIQSFGRRGNKAGELREPYGIAVDTSGRVYISEQGNRRIQIFN